MIAADDRFEVPLYRLVRSRALFGWVIRRVTRSPWNHVQIPLPEGGCLGAHPGGLGREDEATGGHTVYALVSPAQYEAYLTYARSRIGTGYGWGAVAAVGLLQYGIRWRWVRDRVQREDELFCSQFVATSGTAGRIYLFADHRLSMDVTPGDLGNLGALNVGIYLEEAA